MRVMYVLVIPAPSRLKQEDHQFEATMTYNRNLQAIISYVEKPMKTILISNNIKNNER